MTRNHRKAAAPIVKCLTFAAHPNGTVCDPILVYQMSKVGSTSLCHSLQYAYLRLGLTDTAIHHVHALANLDAQEATLRESRGPAAEIARQLAQIQDYKKIRSDFAARSDLHWTTITLVRDPIARHISAFFHHLDLYLPNWRERWTGGKLSIDEVVQTFLATPDYAPEWFDIELKPTLGIDVFSQDFPHEQGYTIHPRTPRATLMVIRLEDLNRVAGDAIHELLGIEKFRLYSFNLATHCEHAEIYERFKQTALPDWYVDRAYSTKLARHFYTDEERGRFAEKWMRIRLPVQSSPA